MPWYTGTFDQTKNGLFKHNVGQWIMTSVKAHKKFKIVNVCGLHHYFRNCYAFSSGESTKKIVLSFGHCVSERRLRL